MFLYRYCITADGEGGLPGGNGQDGGGLPGKDGDEDDGKPTDPRLDDDTPEPNCDGGVCSCPLGWRLQSGRCNGRLSSLSVKSFKLFLKPTSERLSAGSLLVVFAAIVCSWLNFGFPPPQVKWCHCGEVEPFSATLAQDGLTERNQSGKNP